MAILMEFVGMRKTLGAVVMAVACTAATQAQEASPERAKAIEMAASSVFIRKNCPEFETDAERLALSLPGGGGDLGSFMSNPANQVMISIRVTLYEKNRAHSCRELPARYGNTFIRQR
ncbi:hypothetical protein [Microvirga arabica]